MSSLSVYHVSSPDLPNKVLTHFDDITATLAEQGVRFDRWQAAVKLQPGATDEELVAAYQGPLDQLMTDRGYLGVQVISVSSEQQPSAEPQARRLEEQHFEEDHVRFFVAGRGLFNLHIGEYVYAVLCEKNDLILVPAGTRHWFDMGERPHFVAIGLFRTALEPLAHITPGGIAGDFPPLDD
ncbi:acireductone dioxygenase [Pseudomonas sp. RA_35y_Pfl2_P32]|uniref:acireductone dioxygenase n=1 Tax=Pseudomonas sp. RA_35y_Pfl2_P32 TaxID=3088705 RepID=UPI0030DD8C67